MSTDQPAAVIVLAAGEGKRMRSRTPKVLHPIAGRSLVGHALAAAWSLRPEHLAVVVRHQRELVAGHVAQIAPEAVIADQDEVPGTGSAVAAGLRALGPLKGVVVVTYADVPLLSGETLAALVAAHRAEQAAVTVLTAEVGDPTGYGRVLRDAAGNVTGIVEQRDATPEQQAVREINSGIYAFDADVLNDALGRITADNDQNEMYLTDVLGIAHADGRAVRAVPTADLWQVEGVNDRVQLATLGAELNRRLLVAHMRAGVTVVDPASTWVDVDVALASDVTLQPGSQLLAGTTVASGATIGPDSTLSACVVGEGASVIRSHCVGARIEAGAGVGPFSYLRPGTVLGPDGKIGAFVETKNATIGAGAKVPHLTYAGDATIGAGANIGAATIFANYDGVKKHHTTVGAHARVGSDTVLVAPVTIGDGAYTAAGSTITEDVPAGALAVARGRQHNSEGWVAKRREGTPSARAAESSVADPGA
ncbi:bifunctional UDP-N-acetylglucosamine diphosphorylase/glucosamine-1-phosphate N-acetyltransferase GlmU [Kineosporia babensis]|uniref:Bifunctional protein GlmU n=1 Tax=Kineosporia babensis TaxID=499548 RepID=A0A9X1NJS4_9ACTN|nr:bifunctional UDP-N-acetylglucosamine diphosphorylase/glucosamine-1-phosphate N-acetyltransferase GlmU [Kineosporia babensis]